MMKRRFLLYCSVGVLGTGVQYLMLLAIVSLGLADPVTASSVGAVGGAVVNYFLNHKVTFRSGVGHFSAVPKFSFVALIGLGVNWFVMNAVFYFFNIHYLLAQCMASVAVLIVTFLVNRAWSFKT